MVAGGAKARQLWRELAVLCHISLVTHVRLWLCNLCPSVPLLYCLSHGLKLCTLKLMAAIAITYAAAY